MDYNDLVKLLNGERIAVLGGMGFIQLDKECNKFLALLNYEGYEPDAMNLHETIEEALLEINEYIEK